MIETHRLLLVRWEEAHFQAIFSNDLMELGRLLDIERPEKWTSFADMANAVPFLYDFYKKNGSYWGCFFTILKADKKLIGTCGYKGNPNEKAEVEIGYEIDATYRQQGFASEAAKGLIDFAYKHDDVKKVIAHTLAQDSPSVSVLKKLGFQFVGELYDLDDGHIWQWTLER